MSQLAGADPENRPQMPTQSADELSNGDLAMEGLDVQNGTDQHREQRASFTESERLHNLQAEIRDQDDLERDIERQANALLSDQADERDRQRLEKTNTRKEKLESQVRNLRERVAHSIGTTQRARAKNEIEKIEAQIDDLVADSVEIENRIEHRRGQKEGNPDQAPSTGKQPHESQRDYLIRTGKITPFSNFGLTSQRRSASNLQEALLNAEEDTQDEATNISNEMAPFMSHRNLRQPGFRQRHEEDRDLLDHVDSDRPQKRRKFSTEPDLSGRQRSPARSDTSAWSQGTETGVQETSDEDDLIEHSDSMPTTKAQKKSRAKTQKKTPLQDGEIEDLRGLDDGNEILYRSRVRRWTKTRHEARLNKNEMADNQIEQDDGNLRDQGGEEAEAHLCHPEAPDACFDRGYKIPGDIYPNLFDYQKTGVQWLWELYSQQVGGIIGDEMGLGKTIQVIAFLGGLHYSKMLSKPIIVVCPATVMKQWVSEFHRWWPPFRVAILHSSGSGMMNLSQETTEEERLLERMWDPDRGNSRLTISQKKARKVLNPVLEQGGVLVTTYSGLQTYAPLLIPAEWQYAILDEGHKIRNPNAAITIYCKELRTQNRIILSGTPMQNNLVELWSLFDFIFPMRLGTLVSFRTQFELPIRQGGYANASNLQVQTALKCAETLKDAISPYLLQRFKVDVAADLPKKSEQVLFCRLTDFQRKSYKSFLDSNEMGLILSGRRQVLYGVDILRKLCNHPDLQDHKRLANKSDYNYGSPTKSGKMQVVGSLLQLWKENGHKTLLFAQHRIMLDILEKYIKSMPGFRYRRMDGNTPIQARQDMVDSFNKDPDIHIFLLTTKVGGLGINLTGADRVIIYDPDWNPSTDLQARERAWRLGQKREVTIYRLMTAGTIEEKIYHRQIFKQFLTNKILRDPKQRQTFHLSDLHDLFALGDDRAPTETSTLFKDAEVKFSHASGSKSATDPQSAARIESQTKASALGNIEGIHSAEQFQGEAEEKKHTTSSGTNSESRMMEGIFARSSIHSAIEHDQIVGAKKAITADPHMIEQEAKKVAAAAAKELRKASEVAKTVPTGTPTWTGQFGVSGRPQEVSAAQAFSGGLTRNQAGPSSLTLLANLQRTQLANSAANTNGQGGDRAAVPSPAESATTGSRSGTPGPPLGRDWAKLIRDYLLQHGGSVFTQMLIEHFNRLCTTTQSTANFKETLKMIASLERGSGGRGRWVLKAEYKPDR